MPTPWTTATFRIQTGDLVLPPAERTGSDARDRPLEWSTLSRAMDEADDEMTRRGHRGPSWSTEEYAAEVRSALRRGPKR